MDINMTEILINVTNYLICYNPFLDSAT